MLRCQGSTDRGPCVLLSWTPCSPRLTTCRSASMTNLSLTPRHPRACRNRGRGKGSEPRHHRQELPPSGHCWRLFLEHQSSLRSTSSIFLLSPAQSAPTWPVATPLYLAVPHLCCVELLILPGRFQAFCEFLRIQGSQWRGRKGQRQFYHASFKVEGAHPIHSPPHPPLHFASRV